MLPEAYEGELGDHAQGSRSHGGVSSSVISLVGDSDINVIDGATGNADNDDQVAENNEASDDAADDREGSAQATACGTEIVSGSSNTVLNVNEQKQHGDDVEGSNTRTIERGDHVVVCIAMFEVSAGVTSS